MKQSTIDPKFWGPLTWRLMFIFGLSYPINTPSPTLKKQYKDFYLSLQHLLPCPVCRDGFQKFLTKHPIDRHLNSVKDLLVWLCMLYNEKRPIPTQVHTLDDISKKIIKPDITCNNIIKSIKTTYPNARF